MTPGRAGLPTIGGWKIGADMTTKAAFTPEEWKRVLEGPTSAGMLVVTAAHGGMVKETIAMSKAYAEARSQRGASELLDEIVGTKPKTDHTRYRSREEMRLAGLTHVRDAISVLQEKATPEEVEDYRHFVVDLAHRVASAHKEDGLAESPAELSAIEEIESALNLG
jgi:hypothetical protein